MPTPAPTPVLDPEQPTAAQAPQPDAQPLDPHPIDMGPVEHPVTDEPTPAHDPQADASALTLELAQWQDRYTRLVAEFDNYRKRTAREKEALLTYGAEPMAKAVLPVADDLERSLQAARTSQNLPALIEGLEMVQRKLQTALEQQGIVPIDALGKPFDSHEHEAIASLPTDDDAKKGTVIDQVERGYRYRDRVLRYAKVITGE